MIIISEESKVREKEMKRKRDEEEKRWRVAFWGRGKKGSGSIVASLLPSEGSFTLLHSWTPPSLLFLSFSSIRLTLTSVRVQIKSPWPVQEWRERKEGWCKPNQSCEYRKSQRVQNLFKNFFPPKKLVSRTFSSRLFFSSLSTLGNKKLDERKKERKREES